jgi:uroporphyrin-III C-methyltransferase
VNDDGSHDGSNDGSNDGSHDGVIGFVSLIGAGPGNPDNLTLRGAAALARAEVVVYDALLEPSFREYFPAGAEQHFVGKRCGKHSSTQDEINALLVAQAKRGRRVARLKGGDAGIFGRLGEELSALRAAGVPFEVVPGVSALTAGAAAAGFPLTLRGTAREVLIVNGHDMHRPGYDFRPLRDFDGTLVIFMGAAMLSTLARGLLGAGANPAAPLAFVEGVATAGEHVAFSTLGEAAQGKVSRKTDKPGIIYVGRVAASDRAASP